MMKFVSRTRLICLGRQQKLRSSSWLNKQDASVAKWRRLQARCWFHQLSSHIPAFSCPLHQTRMALHLWLLKESRAAGATDVFILNQTKDFSQFESNKSIKTILFRWQTGAFLANYCEQRPGKTRKLIISFSASNTNSMLNSPALLEFPFAFGKLD